MNEEPLLIISEALFKHYLDAHSLKIEKLGIDEVNAVQRFCDDLVDNLAFEVSDNDLETVTELYG